MSLETHVLRGYNKILEMNPTKENILEEPLEVQIGSKLIQRSFKLAVAESCTGGLIGHRITNIPGSSEYYLGSVTAYAYEAKERLLGVSMTPWPPSVQSARKRF